MTVAGRTVELTAIEYNLLVELSLNAARVLTHDHLLRTVWGFAATGSPGTVRTAVKRLRRKLGDTAGNPRYVFSVPSVGYRMGRDEAPKERD